MFLPRIMIERYGWPGFLVFAIPNVLGCAGFGYVLKSRARSQAMVANHAPAMTWFSVITIAFHMFFLVYLFTQLAPTFEAPPWMSVGIAAMALGIGAALSTFGNRGWLAFSVLVYGVSLAAFASVGFAASERIGWSGETPAAHLYWLAPAIIFGFLLCPYLDLTFHRAIQHSDSRHAFGVFGLTFAAMIVLTCMLWFSPSSPILPAIGVAHILAQSVFTIGAHLREIRLSPAIQRASLRGAAMVGPLLAAPLLFIGRFFSESSAAKVGEEMYLRFLVFYGLLFPAYVLLFVALKKRARSRRALTGFAVVMAASLPFYELGFLHDRSWLVTMPLLAVIAWAMYSRMGVRVGDLGDLGKSENENPRPLAGG